MPLLSLAQSKISSFKVNIPCSFFKSTSSFLVPCSLFIQFHHSLFLVHYSFFKSTSSFLVPCSLFTIQSTQTFLVPSSISFIIPCSLFIIHYPINFIIPSSFFNQLHHSLFLVHYSNQPQLVGQRPNRIFTRGTRARASFTSASK